MGLAAYRHKRDFRRSPEPRGRRVKSRAQLRFVVQKHAARRLHYDFRLELDGVLRSWAVPKGPSLDAREKRLAVHVEDHPLEYGSFEGIIPEGEYGAGTVLLWDQGFWKPEGDPREGCRKGRLKFQLQGRKLRGGWTLVRMGGKAAQEGRDNWLLIKERDAAARPLSQGDILEEQPDSVAARRPRARAKTARSTAHKSSRKSSRKEAPRPEGARRGPLPAFVEPELATLVRDPPSGDDWLHEIKLDGYRMLGRVHGGRARLLTRNAKDWTRRFPQLAEAAAALPVDEALLDGEIVALDENGISSFQALQNALSAGRPDHLVYFVFDLLHHDGYDLRAARLRERKAVLAGLLPDSGNAIRYSGEVEGRGEAVFREACLRALEGIVSKHKDAPYRSGRGQDWRKVKCLARQEFVIGGYTEPRGARAGLGALLLGVHDDGRLRFAGRVGTGFSAASLAELHRRLRRLEQSRPAFAEPPRGAAARGVHWVKPRLVAEVAFSNWTRDGRLRQPVFEGLREDKEPDEIRRERARTPRQRSAALRETAMETPASPRRASPAAEVAGVRLTHPERVLYPEQGITKRALARYYERIADWILPHVVQRPLSLVRCPQGYGKTCFYQKHAAEGASEHLKRVRVPGEAAPYLAVADVRGLVSLVQLGVLEIHPWGAQVGDLEHPDRLTLDLDPAPGVAWARVVATAKALHQRLSDLGLRSFVKTTGGKGLHVVVPLAPRHGWAEVKEFTRALAEECVRRQPDWYVAKASKAARSGKIFIDYLRNARGATAVAAYSARARAQAPVSTPLRWEELSAKLRPDGFTVASLPRRLSALRADPWQGMHRLRQTISRSAFRALGLR
ncbi:MAG: DNA ligase D [Planctomycetota bacterium]|nr:MAG: DNA ligase D [Planctomycetota bacterium]